MDSLEQLACWAFNCDRAQLYTGDYEADEENIKLFHEALDSYARGIPAQYITGEAEFMGFDFDVNPSVLIPRPETETFVERVLTLMEREGITEPSILDLGTGSGAIAVSLTKLSPSCKMVASDVSEEALEVGRENAAANGVGERIEFVLSDLFERIPGKRKFDLVISNPPYIPSEDYDSLPPEVRSEPRIALDGGRKGLEFYKKIIPDAAKRLNRGGYLALEIGYGQAQAINDLLASAGSYRDIEILKDYNDIDRIVFAKRR
ncbi:MAG: peptide chain release factor N(5)-glutamine methyltransferase [Candidatus Omnitrophica bacterium]|nr:peptide chain release factor N(5)-glutamine methyltransferase [Candidatus Omnitrophota bacterium]